MSTKKSQENEVLGKSVLVTVSNRNNERPFGKNAILLKSVNYL